MHDDPCDQEDKPLEEEDKKDVRHAILRVAKFAPIQSALSSVSSQKGVLSKFVETPEEAKRWYEFNDNHVPPVLGNEGAEEGAAKVPAQHQPQVGRHRGALGFLAAEPLISKNTTHDQDSLDVKYENA